MTKLLKSLWGRLLFQGRGIVPTVKFLFVYAFLSLVMIVLGSLFSFSAMTIIALNIIVLLCSLVDLLLIPKRKEIIVKRIVDKEIERGKINHIQIQIENHGQQTINYQLIDAIPQSFASLFPLTGEIAGGNKQKVSYEIIAKVRGKYTIQTIDLRYRSQIGLWEKHMTIKQEDQVKVIPDLTETRNYLDDAQKFMLHEGDRIRKHHRGMGEFSQIRNYVVGDDPRMINWRQTAKTRELMTNEFEPEHGKYITILIDCSRMMGAELKKANRLERSLESALVVAAAALSKGDYVSVIAFSKGVKVYVPPAKGIGHLQTILQAVYNVQVDSVEANYGEVFAYLETVQKKRSFILLFSDVRTFLYEKTALTYLLKMRKRHFFFMIGVEDETLHQRADEIPETTDNSMVKSIAQQQILRKKRERARWEKQGLQMMETKEEHLATAAVSYYIDTMNRNMI